MSSYFLLQEIVLIQGSNPHPASPVLAGRFYTAELWGSPSNISIIWQIMRRTNDPTSFTPPDLRIPGVGPRNLCLGHFLSGPVVKTPCCQQGSVGSIPGRGTKIPHAVRCSQKIFKKRKEKCFNKSLVHAKVGESLLWISKSESGLHIKNTRQAFKSPITQATPHSNELN